MKYEEAPCRDCLESILAHVLVDGRCGVCDETYQQWGPEVSARLGAIDVAVRESGLIPWIIENADGHVIEPEHNTYMTYDEAEAKCERLHEKFELDTDEGRVPWFRPVLREEPFSHEW
jgi:hypothetical protein